MRKIFFLLFSPWQEAWCLLLNATLGITWKPPGWCAAVASCLVCFLTSIYLKIKGNRMKMMALWICNERAVSLKQKVQRVFRGLRLSAIDWNWQPGVQSQGRWSFSGCRDSLDSYGSTQPFVTAYSLILETMWNSKQWDMFGFDNQEVWKGICDLTAECVLHSYFFSFFIALHLPFRLVCRRRSLKSGPQ